MRRRQNLLVSVLWRLLVSLAIFNPVFSISHWVLIYWSEMKGIALIVIVVTALVVIYMLSLVRDFPGTTFVAAIAIAAFIAAFSMQGWIDPRSVTFWQWAGPVVAGLIFAAGPVYNMLRQRDSGVVGTDETEGH